MWNLSSPTRNRTCVLCLRRQILNHCTNREVPQTLLTSDIFSISKASLSLKIQSVNVAMNPLYKHQVRDDCVQGRLDKEAVAEKERGQGPWRSKCPASTCVDSNWFWRGILSAAAAAAAAKSLQLCPTLCDPIDGSPPGSPVPGILQARTLEWAAISFSSAWKWKVKVKLLSRVRLFETPWTAAYQAPLSMGFSRQESWSGSPVPSPYTSLGPGNSMKQRSAPSAEAHHCFSVSLRL